MVDTDTYVVVQLVWLTRHLQCGTVGVVDTDTYVVVQLVWLTQDTYVVVQLVWLTQTLTL